jgi:hypothetical protein
MMISIEGISYEDASAQLGVAAGTLKCRVFRARAQLQLWMLGVELGADAPKAPARRRKPTLDSPAVRYHPGATESDKSMHAYGY